MILPISRSKKRSSLRRADLTKKADTDPLVFLHTLVSFQPTCTWLEVKHMTGAHVVTAKWIQSVTVSASGFWRDVAQSLSTSQSPAITNFAIARCHPTLPSATELTNISGSGEPRIIVDFGQWQVSSPSGAPLAIGSSLSTNEGTRLVGC